MSADPANRFQDATRPHKIVFVVFPKIALLDLAGPLQVFSWARRTGSESLAYDVSIVSNKGGRIMSDTLVSIDTEPVEAWRNKPIETLVVVGGDGVYTAAEDQEFVARVAELAENAERVCSVCSGAFLLASAGLLSKRRVVTHWEDAKRLKAEFPQVRLELDPIYIKDGNLWTSAGVTAGTDMSLAIVAEDFGHDAALERAQALVTYMVRPGGQSQFSTALKRQRLDRSGRFSALHQWISENLETVLRVEDLAEHENMSLRNFHRLYLSTMGITPAKSIESIRLEAARDKLELTRASIKSVAFQCGFQSESNMRRVFVKNLGISPSQYRERFQFL